MMGKISKPEREPKLPQDQEPPPEPRHVDLDQLSRAICLTIIKDPVSSAAEKLRALEMFIRHSSAGPPTVEQLVNAEVAAMTDQQLDELLGLATQPMNDRD